ncbi:MAG: LptA/OstA family protein [Candidatus Acidiferrum sp.]
MKRSEAARYARWSALTALLLAAITGGIYLRRQWIAHLEIKKAPPPLTEDKERQSIGLTLSKNEGERTIFTVQASKSTDFKGQDISLLEDVKVTVFGKLGDRHDVIHTQSCKYAKADGSIQCSGNVQMDLQSAADAQRAQAQGDNRASVIHVETSGVTFERATGRAETAQLVKFTFPNGEGEGVGAIYVSEEGLLRLVKDVQVTVRAAEPMEAKKKEGTPAAEVELHGSSLEMGKQSRKVVLYGPATATTNTQQLTAGELTMNLDAQFRAETLIAAPGDQGEKPQVISRAGQGPAGAGMLRADLLRAELAPEGWIRSVEAQGNVQAKSLTGEMQAESATVEMWARVNQAKLATLRGNVRVNQHDAKTETERKLATNVLQLNFGGGRAGEPNPVRHAETLAPGTMEWSDAAAALSKLSANKLAVDFGAAGKARNLVATGNVETQRELKGKPTQSATAAMGDAQLDAAGGWNQMTLRENVHMTEGERTAEAQQAVFVRAAQTAVLTGQALVRDESSETGAAKITFHQGTGEIEAEGKVRSTDLGTKKDTIELSPAPANISADHMVGNSKTGRVLYSGHARLWQGPSVLEADTIELLRSTRVLNANANVRAVFPQVGTDNKKGKEAAIWHVSSGTLTFWDTENRAHLEKNVVVQSADERMRGPVLDLYFTREGSGAKGTAQISRAVSTGGVVVEQGNRRGTAERGVYTAEDKKFVLSGGTPTLYDASEGTTTGRELTFNIADDTIIVDSGNGTRTLTKHRVQR